MLIYLSIVDMHKQFPDDHEGAYVVDIPEILGDSHYDILAFAVPQDDPAFHAQHAENAGRLIRGKTELEKAFGPLVDGSGEPVSPELDEPHMGKMGEA